MNFPGKQRVLRSIEYSNQPLVSPLHSFVVVAVIVTVIVSSKAGPILVLKEIGETLLFDKFTEEFELLAFRPVHGSDYT